MTNEAKKFITLSLLAVITILILVFLIVFPATSSIQENKKAIAKSQNELSQIQDKIDDLKKIKKDKDTKSMMDKISTLWPADKSVSSFIIDLENLATSEKLTFDNLSISEVSKPKSKKDGSAKAVSPDIQFSFSTSGSYSQVYSAIKKLETFSRFNTVTSLAVSQKDEATVSLQLTGLIYYGE